MFGTTTYIMNWKKIDWNILVLPDQCSRTFWAFSRYRYRDTISHDNPSMFISVRTVAFKTRNTNCAAGKDPSSFVSETNIMSKIFFDISSDIFMNFLRILLIFKWPVVMFWGCESLNFFSVDIKWDSWYSSFNLDRFSVWTSVAFDIDIGEMWTL